MITFAVSIFLIFRLNVEKNLKEEQKLILEHQKQAVLAEGGVWEDPAVREKREQEEADRKAEQERITELKAYCTKKGFDFEEENRKYLEKEARKKNSLIGKLLG